MKMKNTFCVILGLIMILSLVSCAPTQTEPTASEAAPTSKPATESAAPTVAATAATSGPASGGTLNLGVVAEASSLLWINLNHPVEAVQGMPFYEALLRINENGEPEPYLCKTFTPDADALTYTVELKEGITFQDGTPLNAEAAVWSLQMYKERGRKTTALMPNIESFEVTGEYTFVIHMTKWDSTVPYSLAREAGYMFSKDAWDKNGEEYCAQHPVGTGPFIMTDWKMDVSKTYEKYADYWQGEPLLDEIVVTIYADSLVAQAALESGEMDVFFSVDYGLVNTLASKGFGVSTGVVMASIPLLCYNSVNPDDVFHDVKVRQAISHAIDQAGIDDSIYYGYTIPTNQFAGPSSVYYSNEVVGYDYNPALAKELLAAAGYPNGFETTLEVKNEPTLVAIATAIQAQLAEVDVDVEIIVVDAADYGVALTGWESGMLMHPSSLPTDIVQQAASMWIQGLSGICLGLTSIVRPDDVNQYITDAVSAKTELEKQELMKKAQVSMIDEWAMYWPLGVGYNTFVKGSRVHDDGINDIIYYQGTLWKAWVE
jgi:peptide/nickel transport system substrate-binding protein